MTLPSPGLAATIALFLVSLLAARLALRTSRTPQGAMGWVVFLLSLPLVALPFYALFGGIYRMNRHRTPTPPEGEAGDDDTTGARLHDLQDAVASRLLGGNDVTLLENGPETFGAIFDAIDAAEAEILVQYYTLHDDETGERLKHHLIEARKRGVEVKVLVDAMGSLRLGRRYVRQMREGGIDFRGNFSFRRSFYRLGLNYRNHRKAVVIDGRVGLTGGLNAAQEYVDGGKHFDTWRDTFLRLRGPVVSQLHRCFSADWKAVTGEEIDACPSPEPGAGTMQAMHVAAGPTAKTDIARMALLGLIAKAQRRLWIASPYLVPPADIASALQLAAQRGIEVRILVPRAIDKYMPWLAGRAYFRELHDYGVHIHEYQPGFMHQKIVLVDDDIAAIGTINLDYRSILLNFEQTVLVEHTGFAKNVEAMLTRDFADSIAYDGQKMPWAVRLLAPVAKLFAPML